MTDMDVQGEDRDEHGDGEAFATLRARIVASIDNGDYRQARAELRTDEALSRDAKRKLISDLNDSLLRGKSLEWTSHGIKKSFRFWSDKEKVRYLKFANQLVGELRTLTEDVCLGFGSVLSIVRDGDLIPHDDDLDIILVLPGATSLQSSLLRVQEYLLEKGYVVKGNHLSHRKVKKRGLYKVDVFVGIQEADRLSIFPSKRRLIKYSDVFPATKMTMLGCDCHVPGEPLNYLAAVYGEDWRTPKPNWHHSWDKAEYAELL